MTKQLPPNPDGLNNDRATWAGEAIRAFMDETETDRDDALGDLLCDLMHWADRNGQDFNAMIRRAQMHYQAETRDPPTADDLLCAEIVAVLEG